MSGSAGAKHPGSDMIAIPFAPMSLRIQIRRLPSSNGLPLPTYMTAGAAGMDLHAAVAEDLVIPPWATVLVPTGLEIAIPPGFEGQIRPRSAGKPIARAAALSFWSTSGTS